MDGFISDEADLSWVQVIPTDKQQPTNVGINPPGQYSQVVEGADIATSAISQGNTATYTHTNLGIGFAVSLQSKLTMPRETLVQFIGQLGASARRRIAQDCYDQLTNGESTTGRDGVSSFNTGHGSNVGAMSNLGASSLDYTGLEAGIRSIATQQTPDGLLCGYKASTLIVPAALNVTSQQLVGSTFTSAGLQINSMENRGLKVIVAPELTSATAWFLLDDRFSSYKMYVLRGPAPKLIEEEEASMRMAVRDRMIYAVGSDSWRGTFSSSP